MHACIIQARSPFYMYRQKKRRLPDNCLAACAAGDPAQNRTGNLLLRRQALYPIELRNHMIAGCCPGTLFIIYYNTLTGNLKIYARRCIKICVNIVTLPINAASTFPVSCAPGLWPAVKNGSLLKSGAKFRGGNFSAAQIGAEKHRGVKISIGQIGAAQIGPGHFGRAKIGGTEVGLL